MSDEQQELRPPELDDEQDVEAQGLRESMAIAVGIGALAVPTTALGYPTPEPGGPADRPGAVVTQTTRAPSGTAARTAKKAKKAKKAAKKQTWAARTGAVVEPSARDRPAGHQPQ
jgi:hypothetical protein